MKSQVKHLEASLLSSDYNLLKEPMCQELPPPPHFKEDSAFRQPVCGTMVAETLVHPNTIFSTTSTTERGHMAVLEVKQQNLL